MPGGIALGLGVAGGFALFSSETSLTLGIAVAEAAALRIILTAVEEKEPSALTRVLSLPALVYVGRISYGLYLFHHPLTFALNEEMGLHWTLVTALTLPASLAAAALSYHFIEQPILSRARASRAAAAAPDAAVHDVTVAPAFARRFRTAKRAHVARSGRDRVLSWRQARRRAASVSLATALAGRR